MKPGCLLIVMLLPFAFTSVSIARDLLSFLSPKSDEAFDVGACIPLQAQPPAGTSIIRYFDGASLIGEASAPAFRLMWNTATRGPHTLRAVASNAAGEVSAVTNISVNDSTRPIDLKTDVDSYNVSFKTLGNNARDSMPLGNGDVSLNVWTYPDGDVGLLIGKLDAYAETGNLGGASGAFNLRKIGRVRISLDPPVFKEAAEAETFLQTLVLSESAIHLQGTGGELKIWVDKNASVIHAEWNGSRDVTMTAKDDSWRTSVVPKTHVPDIVFPNQPNQVVWCYHDPRKTVGYRTKTEKGLVEMGAPGAEWIPQYSTVTFGALMEGPGLERVDDLTLRSPKSNASRLDIHVLRYSRQNEATPELWHTKIQAQAEAQRALKLEQSWQNHLQWWRNYWDRSWLIVTKGDKCREVTAAYLHNRFINACQAGALSELWRIPFNGGTLSVDFLDIEAYKPINKAKTDAQKQQVLQSDWTGVNPQDQDADKLDPSLCAKMTADFRLWGAADRSQNTRHVYGPMLMSGDFDVARPWYTWPGIVAQYWEKQVEQMTGKKGCIFNTGISAWEGLDQIQFINRGDQYISRIVPEGIGNDRGSRNWTLDVCDEYLPYMIDYYELTRDQDFLTTALLPYAEKKFRFFDEWFPRDNVGKLILWPCEQSEIYVRYPKDGQIPANPIAGVAMLHSQLPRLLALDGQPGVTPEMLALWKKVYDARPDMPIGPRRNGKLGLLPHELGWDEEQKLTQGQDRATLYTMWPYRAIMFPESGVQKGDYDAALNAFRLDDGPSMHAWFYGDYCAAILGLAPRAKQGVITRAAGRDKNFRFPYFWHSRPDWAPCPEFGGILQSTMQYMLWNWKGDKIYICPAWPKDWDCSFKFRGPRNTVVSGTVTDGSVRVDSVIPESRRKDLVIRAPQ